MADRSSALEEGYDGGMGRAAFTLGCQHAVQLAMKKCLNAGPQFMDSFMMTFLST
ncbi:hypothetical protein MASR2M48_22040 [Spirochaetota bacterium]